MNMFMDRPWFSDRSLPWFYVFAHLNGKLRALGKQKRTEMGRPRLRLNKNDSWIHLPFNPGTKMGQVPYLGFSCSQNDSKRSWNVAPVDCWQCHFGHSWSMCLHSWLSQLQCLKPRCKTGVSFWLTLRCAFL